LFSLGTCDSYVLDLFNLVPILSTPAFGTNGITALFGTTAFTGALAFGGMLAFGAAPAFRTDFVWEEQLLME
jgi:hypothetical protein